MSQIDLRVQFQGSERLLRLQRIDSEWHGRLLIPGEEDLLTSECPKPSLPGVQLPRTELNDMTLRIDAFSGKVLSLGMVRLHASGGGYVKDGQIVFELTSIMQDARDGLGDRMQEQDRAQILKCPKQRERGDRDMER